MVVTGFFGCVKLDLLSTYLVSRDPQLGGKEMSIENCFSAALCILGQTSGGFMTKKKKRDNCKEIVLLSPQS